MFIYGLKDPRNFRPRYVGLTTNSLIHRLSQHMCDKTNTYKTAWIKSLIKNNLSPEIFIIEEINLEPTLNNRKFLAEREMYWIKALREKGYKLTNGTDGGDGVLGLLPETIEKIKKSNTGQKRSPEIIAAMSERMKKAWANGTIKVPSQKGKKSSEETKEKISKASSEKERTPESNLKRSITHKKMWKSRTEAKQKIVNYLKNKTASHIQNNALSNLKLTYEQRMDIIDQYWIQGTAQRDLAKKYEVSRMVIVNAVKNRNKYTAPPTP